VARAIGAQTPTAIRFAASAPVIRADLGFMYLGIPTGFYQRLGIKGDFVTAGSSAAAIQLVAVNDVQIANLGITELMAAKEKQPTLPVRAVYLQDVLSSYEVIVPAKSSYKSPADLKGKAIGVSSLGSGAVPFTKALMRSVGIDPSGIQLLAVGAGPQALAALRGGHVEALSVFRGQTAALENLNFEFRSFTADVPNSVLAVNEQFLARNRDAVIRALQGVILNTIYMEVNPSAAVRGHWQLFGKPKDDEEKAMREGVHLIRRTMELWKQHNDTRPWGELKPGEFKKLVDFLGPEIGIPAASANLAKYYTGDLIAEINKVDTSTAYAAAKAAPAR
jgi:NitT/TauT family transport system substrate-binding protein